MNKAAVQENLGIKRKAFVFHTSTNQLNITKRNNQKKKPQIIDHSYSVVRPSHSSCYLQTVIKIVDKKLKAFSEKKTKHSLKMEMINNLKKCNGNLKKLKKMIRVKRNSSSKENFDKELKSIREHVNRTHNYIQNLNINNKEEIVRCKEYDLGEIEKTIELSENKDYLDINKVSSSKKVSIGLEDNMFKIRKSDFMNMSWNNNYIDTTTSLSIIQSDNNNGSQLTSGSEYVLALIKEKDAIIKQKEEIELQLRMNIQSLQEELELQKGNYNSIQKSLQITMDEISKGERLRIQLHNYIQEIRGNLRVFCRVKPRNDMDTPSCLWYPEIYNCQIKQKNNCPLTTLELKDIRTRNNISTYHFDNLFTESSFQTEIFQEIKPFIQSAIDGENICIFAYGATGTGKTYTMQGPIYSSLINEYSGILPRTTDFIFDEIYRLEKFSEKGKINLSLSAIEIYNEMIYDLLNNESKFKQPLALSNTQIKNMVTYKINNKADIVSLCEEASKSRRCESTLFNSSSSRSHAIYMLKLQFSGGIRKESESIINIIDLAGSEKCSLTSFEGKSKSEIEMMKKIQNEASFINKSLTCLGRVISMLADKKANKAKIPYRDSKLTMMLKNSLKPSSKTVLIITISPNEELYSQTKDTLLFASNALLAF